MGADPNEEPIYSMEAHHNLQVKPSQSIRQLWRLERNADLAASFHSLPSQFYSKLLQLSSVFLSSVVGARILRPICVRSNILVRKWLGELHQQVYFSV